MISEFPLLVFTVLTGLAAGGYAMSTVFGLLVKQKRRKWVFPLICLVLLGLGMLGVLAHLGHPERFLNALANPTAMITQEAYWSIPFGCLLLIDAILLKIGRSKGYVLPILGSIFGLGLMTVTSIAYFTSYGVEGWPEIPTIFLFLVGDLAMGASFTVAFSKISPSTDSAENSSDNHDVYRVAQRSFCLVAVALYLVLAIALIAEAFVFAGLTVGPWGFAISAVLIIAAVILQALASFGKFNVPNQGWICFALVAIAVIVSRYSFYAMY